MYWSTEVVVVSEKMDLPVYFLSFCYYYIYWEHVRTNGTKAWDVDKLISRAYIWCSSWSMYINYGYLDREM